MNLNPRTPLSYEAAGRCSLKALQQAGFRGNQSGDPSALVSIAGASGCGFSLGEVGLE